MFFTSFSTVLFNGKHLSDFFLLLHVAFAPLFSIIIAITIVLYAHHNRFNENDFAKLKKNNTFSLNRDGYKKLLFWLLAITSTFVMLPITLSMFPLFGTEGQIVLLEIHKYSVLVFSILVILQSGLILIPEEVEN